MKLAARVRRHLLSRLLPIPVDARHAEYSVIASADDEASRPTPAMLELAVEAVRRAPSARMAHITRRMPAPPYYPDVWPGETYKLLAGFIAALQPSRVIEIGTGVGTSALTMLPLLPAQATLLTFDLVGWRESSGSLLRQEDFADGRLTQSTDDLTTREAFERHRARFEEADFIFLDAAKDGVMEWALLDRLATVSFRAAPWLLMDDIRVWNMLALWRAIRAPKLDLTSFGHWTGTGLVAWPAAPAAWRT